MKNLYLNSLNKIKVYYQGLSKREQNLLYFVSLFVICASFYMWGTYLYSTHKKNQQQITQNTQLLQRIQTFSAKPFTETSFVSFNLKAQKLNSTQWQIEGDFNQFMQFINAHQLNIKQLNVTKQGPNSVRLTVIF
jgi:hypothetical protein